MKMKKHDEDAETMSYFYEYSAKFEIIQMYP